MVVKLGQQMLFRCMYYFIYGRQILWEISQKRQHYVNYS